MAEDSVPPLPTPWAELGWPKPANNPLTKPQVNAAYQQHQLPELKKLWTAQMQKALGVSHFMLRDPETGQWSRLTDPDQIQAALNHADAEAGSTYYIHTKDPDQGAIADILNRIQGKPVEPIEAEVKADVVFSWKADDE